MVEKPCKRYLIQDASFPSSLLCVSSDRGQSHSYGAIPWTDGKACQLTFALTPMSTLASWQRQVRPGLDNRDPALLPWPCLCKVTMDQLLPLPEP